MTVEVETFVILKHGEIELTEEYLAALPEVVIKEFYDKYVPDTFFVPWGVKRVITHNLRVKRIYIKVLGSHRTWSSMHNFDFAGKIKELLFKHYTHSS